MPCCRTKSSSRFKLSGGRHVDLAANLYDHARTDAVVDQSETVSLSHSERTSPARQVHPRGRFRNRSNRHVLHKPSVRRSRRERLPASGPGTALAMTAAVIILLVLALLFGIGAVLEGLAWVFLITILLVIAAVWVAWRKLRRPTPSS